MVRVRLIKLLSLLALIGVFISTYFLTHTLTKLIDNTAGTAYLEQQGIEWKTEKLTTKIITTIFNQQTNQMFFAYMGVTRGEVSNICGKEREIFYVSYPGTLSGSGQDILVIKQYIESNFKSMQKNSFSTRKTLWRNT